MFSDYWTTNKTYFELNGSVPQQDQTGVTLDGLRLNYSDELNFISQRRSLSKVKSFSISLYNLTEHLWGSLLSAVFEKISEHAIDLQGKKKKIMSEEASSDIRYYEDILQKKKIICSYFAHIRQPYVKSRRTFSV